MTLTTVAMTLTTVAMTLTTVAMVITPITMAMTLTTVAMKIILDMGLYRQPVLKSRRLNIQQIIIPPKCVKVEYWYMARAWIDILTTTLAVNFPSDVIMHI